MRVRARAARMYMGAVASGYFLLQVTRLSDRTRSARERKRENPFATLSPAKSVFYVYQTDTREIFSRHWHRASDSSSIREEAQKAHEAFKTMFDVRLAFWIRWGKECAHPKRIRVRWKETSPERQSFALS